MHEKQIFIFSVVSYSIETLVLKEDILWLILLLFLRLGDVLRKELNSRGSSSISVRMERPW